VRVDVCLAGVDQLFDGSSDDLTLVPHAARRGDLVESSPVSEAKGPIPVLMQTRPNVNRIDHPSSPLN
jgi:hypothetical protein